MIWAFPPFLLHAAICAPFACRAVLYANICPRKDAELVIHGTQMGDPFFQLLFFIALRTLIERLGVVSFNASVYNIGLGELGAGGSKGSNGGMGVPVVARVLSRGGAAKLGLGASDYGGLEVFGGASIGHTDPFQLIGEFDATLLQWQHLERG